MTSRFTSLPWLSLCLLATGCPLTDKYALLSGADAGSGGDGAAGSSAAAGSTAGGASAGASAAGGASAPDAGAPDGGGAAGQGPSGGSGGGAGDAGDSGFSGAPGAGAGGTGGGDACSALTCAVACCNGACVDTARDFKNCGGCGKLCNAGRTCAGSVCQSGWVAAASSPLGFAARWRAASVAMGKAVFVWGGEDASGVVLDSGAIYSPVTDSWTPVAKDASTPTARVLATAVWTGSVVVVFGGSDAAGATAYQDGAIYDPAKNSWSTLAMAANRRSGALGFWDGTRAIFWGGFGASGFAVGGADRTDLTNWTTSSTPGNPGPFANPAWASDGSTIYFEGGLLGGARTDQVVSYTTTSDTWATLSKSLTPRSDAFGVWDGTDFVVWGGRDNAIVRNDGKYLSGSIWTNVSAAGAPTARMAPLRRSGWSFRISPGLVAFMGGQLKLGAAGRLATDGATYDVAKVQWTPIPAWPSGEPHEHAVGVWTGEEFVLWSGRDAGGNPSLTGERWRP